VTQINLRIELHNDDNGDIHVMRRLTSLPGVPRVGENITHSSGGWSSDVWRVWWDAVTGEVVIEFRTTHYDPNYEDLYEIAIREGWYEL